MGRRGAREAASPKRPRVVVAVVFEDVVEGLALGPIHEEVTATVGEEAVVAPVNDVVAVGEALHDGDLALR